MAMPIRRPLAVNHAYDASHANQVFKSDLRSKAATDAYFNAFAAGTVTYFGTEGVDYEFHAENGFRTISQTGGMKILVSNILSGDELKYFNSGGWTFDFNILTSEWIEPEYTPPLYDKPSFDLNGTAAPVGVDNTYLVAMKYNTGSVGALVRCADGTVLETKGRNKLEFSFSGFAQNQGVCARRCRNPRSLSCVPSKTYFF